MYLSAQADSPFSQVIIDLDQAAGGETQTTPCCLIPSSNRLVSATQMARVMPSTSSATCTPSTSTVKAQKKKKIHKKMKRQRQETPEDREDKNDLFNNWLESSMSKNKAKEKWCESEIVKNKAKLELAELHKKHLKLQILHLKHSMGWASPGFDVENKGGIFSDQQSVLKQ